MQNAFREYLDKTNTTVSDFEFRSRINKNTLYKILRGEAVRIDTIRKLVRATRKMVREDQFNIISYTKE